MAPSIVNLAPITETEAVNLMLRQIGEQPVADANASTLADVVMALAILKETTREALSEGWKFNTSFNRRVYPTAGSPFNFTDADGSTVSINVFTPPTGLLAFDLTPTTEQQGSTQLDLTLRISEQYQEGSPTPVEVIVFYDRWNNRDGLRAADWPYIVIDPVWFLDFETLPMEMRQYIAISAARKFCQNVPINSSLAQFTADDELAALRQVKRRHGLVFRYNMFNNAHAASSLGLPYRRMGYGSSIARDRLGL